MHHFVKEFKTDTSFLTGAELRVLEKLTEAAKLIARVYEAQVKSDGFYPKDATRKEIEKAAEENPDILSPYTVVERDNKGKLVATPYHVKYKALLVPVADKLTEAAEISTHNQEFRRALLTQARALLNGEYDKAQVEWMRIKPYVIDLVIGPIERVEDNMFFTKRAYQAWVGIMRKNVTDRVNTLKDIVLSSHRQVLVSERMKIDKVQVRADDSLIFAGLFANYNFTAATLPNDVEILEKYGSETWLFLSAIRENFKKSQLPLFKLIFAKFFQNSFKEDDLYRGYLLMVAMHEISRTIVRYRLAISRLREFYPIFNEATTETLAVKMSGMLLLKDVITQKEMEAILIMFITRIYDEYTEHQQNKLGSESLITGNATILNSLVESGALKIGQDGISWPNFTKMFISVSGLADNMETILAEGKYQDAQNYVKKHASLEVFNHFSKALKTLQRE